MATTALGAVHAEESAAVTQKRYAAAHLYLALAMLAVGGIMGLMQALDRVEIDITNELHLSSYYQGLTIHGVALVLVFTFAFANAMLIIATSKGFGRPLVGTPIIAAAFFSMLLGSLMATWAMLSNQASVLFTFYAPLQAHIVFYFGLVLVVISTWLISASQILTLIAWRKDHPNERIPLQAYTSLITYILWDIASLFVAVEVLFFLIPWSAGLVDEVDPQFTRTLFWASGHAIVYVWLLPAYISWYTMVPKMAGGKLFSDALPRLVFILFLLLSTPVGLHHQYTDPGIEPLLKSIHLVLTFGVTFPSIITFFTLMASLENAGRNQGGQGLFGWIWALPWGNPALVGQLLAMLGFILGGISGSVNASATMNLVVHNTSWIPGHFHLTVGTAVALTIMSVMYWMLPYLTGKKLWNRKLALLQVWLYFIGVLIFSRGQIQGGLDGMPRRTNIGFAGYETSQWDLANALTAIGGIVMVISGALFFMVVIGTLLNRRMTAEEAAEVEVPTSEAIHGPETTHPMWDRLGFWTIVAVLGVVAAYLPVLISYLPLNNVSTGINTIY
ncbi:MAG: cbb3-type cytochrome c oxidase subunit I [Dehalococcoidia bacterium]|nr:cbb3-type cytochrome c oxidase subunit I [Dehalococcoidia bacterium]MCA9849878.1 cbb3-type cytochrome c oxidase subunit I [Dehalococcoidia bacterium]MCA9856532.1 cbb3-type cytochrome c oxidase subunit I [Dehalococcoidia bacterium]MCB9482959.1 cbb3-type cytochrome c oxidase subunit I [Dehalococcoidia bacterium]